MNKTAIDFYEKGHKEKLTVEAEIRRFRVIFSCISVCNAESSEGLTFSITVSPVDRQGPSGENPCLSTQDGIPPRQENSGDAGTQPDPEGRETVAPAKLNEKDVDSFAGAFLPESDVYHLLQFLRLVSVDCYHTANHGLSDQATAWERKLADHE